MDSDSMKVYYSKQQRAVAIRKQSENIYTPRRVFV